MEPALRITTATHILESMGARLDVRVDVPPLVAGTRQRDPAHARLSGYTTGRLRHDGWSTATEVEIGGDRSRGWIDVLAFHPVSRVVLVVELKTEIHDLGQIERTLGWYEREAWAAARRLGWRPRRIEGWLILLATEANDARVLANRLSIQLGFPQRSRHLVDTLDGTAPRNTGRGIAMVDPRSRRRGWCRALAIDGRTAPAPYRDYADFMRPATSRARRSAPPPTNEFPPGANKRPRARTTGHRFNPRRG